MLTATTTTTHTHLHRVVDSHARRHGAPRGVDVEGDVLVRVIVGKVKQLRHQHVRDLVVHLFHEVENNRNEHSSVCGWVKTRCPDPKERVVTCIALIDGSPTSPRYQFGGFRVLRSAIVVTAAPPMPLDIATPARRSEPNSSDRRRIITRYVRHNTNNTSR